MSSITREEAIAKTYETVDLGVMLIAAGAIEVLHQGGVPRKEAAEKMAANFVSLAAELRRRVP